MGRQVLLLVLNILEIICSQTHLMCIKYNMIINDYGHRISFLLQGVGDEKLDEKHYSDHCYVQLCSRKELLDNILLELDRGLVNHINTQLVGLCHQ